MSPPPRPRPARYFSGRTSFLRRCVALLLIAALLPIHGLFAFWADASGDGIPDSWVDPSSGEVFTLEDLNAISWDIDGDGLSNASELALGTNPFLADTDGDGLSDAVDPAPLDAYNDSPYNGLAWGGDALGDSDGDGTLNFLDPYPYDYYNGNNPWAGDSDGDGIPNSNDPAPDDYTNTSPINGTSWYGDALSDFDGDGIDNFHDYYPYDSTNGSGDPEPGDPNYSEYNGVSWYGDAWNDADGDGIQNFYDPYPYDPYNGGIPPDYDSDGDGIPDSVDPAPSDPTNYSDRNSTYWNADALGDIDGDGIPNFFDYYPGDSSNGAGSSQEDPHTSDINGISWYGEAYNDADGDGIQNYYDAYPYDPYNGNPPVYQEPDYDGDGISDSSDPSPWDYSNNSAANGISWYGDALGDADGDGIANFYDQWPYDYYNGNAPVVDTDGDGIPDAEDPAPSDPINYSPINGGIWFSAALADADGDGNPNFTDPWPYDPYNGNPPPPANPDIDEDGIPDVFDPAPGDPSNTSSVNWMSWYGDALGDADGDGVLNFYDSYPYDSTNGSYNPNPDSDGDGIPDANDPEPNDPTNYSSYNGTCWYGDALGDSDNDNTQNFYDSYPYDPYNGGSPPDTNPNPDPDPDSDGDGIHDVNDPAPWDPTNTSPINGVAWGGDIGSDADGDGVANFWDPEPYGVPQVDSDSDGLLDNVDPSPFDSGNYSPFNNTSWLSDALGDADGDGIPNFFDEWPYDNQNGFGDMDMDGIPNAADPLPLDPANPSPYNGISWYGEALQDADGDGVLNFFDYYPYGGGGEPPPPPPPPPGGGGEPPPPPPPPPGNENGNGSNGSGSGGGGGNEQEEEEEEDPPFDGGPFTPPLTVPIPSFAIGPIVLLNNNFDELGDTPPANLPPTSDCDGEDLAIKSGSRIGKMALNDLSRLNLLMPQEYVDAGGRLMVTQSSGDGRVRIHAVKMVNGEGVQRIPIVLGQEFEPPAGGDWEYWVEGIKIGHVKLHYHMPYKDLGNDPYTDLPRGAMTEDADGDVELDVCEVSLTVDANRDGVIDSRTIQDMTTKARPFRFWINEDSDSLEMGGKGGDTDTEELIDLTKPDYDSKNAEGIREIKCQRDLEDFTMISLQLSGLAGAIQEGRVRVGLKWTEVSGDEMPKIQIFRCPSGIQTSKEFISDSGTAALFVHKRMAAGIEAKEKAMQGEGLDDEVTWIDPQYLTSPLVRAGKSECLFIFEGAHVGEGKLTLVVEPLARDDEDNSPIGMGEIEADSVNLKLLHAGQMVQRVYATVDGVKAEPDSVRDPWNYSDGFNDQFLYWVSDSKYTFDRDPDETSQCVVHVHGWRMDDDEKRNWSEMSFKRLWHLGYRGRVCSFSWPTYSPENAYFGAYLTYNLSEYRAWKSGAALKKFVDSLASEFQPDGIKIFAHSMGNVVVGSAVRDGMYVGNYVMQHSAMAASAYDGFNEALIIEPQRLTPDTESWNAETGSGSDFYGDNVSLGLSNKFGSAIFGKFSEPGVIRRPIHVANFCLPDDSALSKWVLNHDWNKPTIINVDGYYQYDRNWVQPGREDASHSMHLYYRSNLLSGGRAVQELHEAMAYVTQARCLAAGAEINTLGSVDVRLNLALNPYNFGADHSAEWNHRFMNTFTYWKVLMDQLDLRSELEDYR